MLGRFAQAGEEVQVIRGVRAAGGFDFFNQEVGDAFVEVIATKTCVAVGGEDLKDALVQFEDGEVKRAAAQVVHRDFRMFLELVQTVGERGGGRFVEDPFDRQPRQFARPFRRVALGIVEISGHSDHRARHDLAKISLGVTLQLLEDFRRNFLGSPWPPVNLNRHRAGAFAFDRVGDEHFLGRNVGATAAHEAFDGIDRLRRLEDPHSIGLLPDDRFGVRTGKVHD